MTNDSPSNVVILKQQAKFIQSLRAWLDNQGLTEVFTAPIRAGATNDVGIQSSPVKSQFINGWLQSSPELAMKVLLARGSGDIYQICTAFRDEAISDWHKSQFMMLEWYRIGYSMRDLMKECVALLSQIIDAPYYSIDISEQLETVYGINALSSPGTIVKKANELGLSNSDDAAFAMDVLVDRIIRNASCHDCWLEAYNYPASQPALARIKDGKALRFEYFINGIEVGHGYEELTDPQEQRERFSVWSKDREKLGLVAIDLDESFLSALGEMPKSSGVAFGLDRLWSAKLRQAKMTSFLY